MRFAELFALVRVGSCAWHRVDWWGAEIVQYCSSTSEWCRAGLYRNRPSCISRSRGIYSRSSNKASSCRWSHRSVRSCQRFLGRSRNHISPLRLFARTPSYLSSASLWSLGSLLVTCLFHGKWRNLGIRRRSSFLTVGRWLSCGGGENLLYHVQLDDSPSWSWKEGRRGESVFGKKNY